MLEQKPTDGLSGDEQYTGMISLEQKPDKSVIRHCKLPILIFPGQHKPLDMTDITHSDVLKSVLHYAPGCVTIYEKSSRQFYSAKMLLSTMHVTVLQTDKLDKASVTLMLYTTCKP